MTEPKNLILKALQDQLLLAKDDEARRADILNAADWVTKAGILPPFPVMLRQMWSGGAVQRWIDENWR